MKKIYLSIFSAFIGVASIAQAPQMQLNVKKGVATLNAGKVGVNLTNTGSSVVNSGSRATTINSQLFSPIDDYTGALGTTPGVQLSSYIWPDSNIKAAYSGPTYSAPSVFGIGQVFDMDGYAATLTGRPFDNAVQPLDVDADMTLDSIRIICFQNRFEPNTNVDTAVVSVIDASGLTVFGSSGTDTLSAGVEYSDVNTGTYASVLASYKIPLDSAWSVDTLSSGFNQLMIASNLVIPGSNQGNFAVMVDYKPATPWSYANDTIFENRNVFRVLTASYSNPVAQVPRIGIVDLGGCVANLAGITRYPSQTSNAYPTAFVTSTPIGGGASEPYLHQIMDCDIWISQTNSLTAGINELENGATLFQNYPNPTAGFTTVKYSLENSADVAFEMIDITGKTVFASTEGNKANGVHTISVDTKNLNAGVYFYSVIVNGNKLTKKMTVSK